MRGTAVGLEDAETGVAAKICTGLCGGSTMSGGGHTRDHGGKIIQAPKYMRHCGGSTISNLCEFLNSSARNVQTSSEFTAKMTQDCGGIRN